MRRTEGQSTPSKSGAAPHAKTQRVRELTLTVQNLMALDLLTLELSTVLNSVDVEGCPPQCGSMPAQDQKLPSCVFLEGRC